MDGPDLIERRLIAGYQQQASEYENALRIVEDGAAGNGAATAHVWVQNLHEVLRRIAVLDAELSEAKAAWREAGKSPGPTLQHLLDGLARQISSLRLRVDAQVAELTERKQRLLPEVDDFIRQRWTLRAYGQAAAAPKK